MAWNVRELKHTIEHAVIAEGNTLTANCLPRTFRKEKFSKKKGIMPLREALHQTEKELIDQALIETEGIYYVAKCWYPSSNASI